MDLLGGHAVCKTMLYWVQAGHYANLEMRPAAYVLLFLVTCQDGNKG